MDFFEREWIHISLFYLSVRQLMSIQDVRREAEVRVRIKGGDS